MPAAVQFHIQLRLLTEEIQIVNSDGVLAAEFVAGETAVTQPAPDQFFRPRFFFAKLPGAFDVGLEANLANGGKAEKLVLTPALILAFSPEEKEQPLVRFRFFG